MAQPVQGKKGEDAWLGRDIGVGKDGEAGIRLQLQ